MTLREIKRRIKAVEGTRKITRAMGFVATVVFIVLKKKKNA